MEAQTQLLTVKQKFPWLILLLALCLGFIFSEFFFHRPTEIAVKPNIVSPEKIKNNVTADQTKTEFRTDSLNEIASRLNRIAADQKINAKVLSVMYAAFSDSALAFADRVNRVSSNDYENGDNSAALRTALKELRNIHDREDSACTASVDTLEALVRVKDTLINALGSSNRYLRLNFDSLYNQQKTLLSYNDKLEKKIRKKNFGNAALKVLLVSAGGLFIFKSVK